MRGGGGCGEGRGMEHAAGTGKDLSFYSRSQGQPFQCLYRGMTCSGLPCEEGVTEHRTNTGGSATRLLQVSKGRVVAVGAKAVGVETHRKRRGQIQEKQK